MEAWLAAAAVLAALAVCGFVVFKQMQSEEMKGQDKPDSQRQR